TLTYIGDVDGDGEPELCATYRDGSNHLKVDVYDHDGALRKTLDRGSSGYDSFSTVLTHTGDYVVIGYDAGYSLVPRGVGIMRYSTGQEISFLGTGGSRWGSFAMGDLDQDGTLQI